MSFSQGLSGLNAASQALDVIGNNISNAHTVGFKSGGIIFSDIFADSKVGLGVQVADVNQNFKDGVLTDGNHVLDIGIQGNGFFRLEDSAGNKYYSRNGQFRTDENGFIVNSQGKYLTGYQGVGSPPVITPGGTIDRIKIPSQSMPARASDQGYVAANLNAASLPVKKVFSPKDNSTFSAMTQMDAYDSLGHRHSIQLFYVKTGDNAWKIYSLDSTSPEKKEGNSENNYQMTDIVFDSVGKLEDQASFVKVKGQPYMGGDALDFTVDLAGLTQHASSAPIDPSHVGTTGYGAGVIHQYTIEDNGKMVATYSNGQKQSVSQILLSHFINPGGLSAQNNNCWSETTTSGQPVNGISGTGHFGKLYSNRLESSNVDLSQEMVSMIVFQKNYQSNSQTIRTQSELLQTLMNIG